MEWDCPSRSTGATLGGSTLQCTARGILATFVEAMTLQALHLGLLVLGWEDWGGCGRTRHRRGTELASTFSLGLALHGPCLELSTRGRSQGTGLLPPLSAFC